uniref:Uncharacterized protein n=1 Tax=Setaria viridis TaxID=4556 RepID=A0A4U6TVM6_SETVI|nr:hypothetical protein SEVIR_7G192950v2 [Setaria viridis]
MSGYAGRFGAPLPPRLPRPNQCDSDVEVGDTLTTILISCSSQQQRAAGDPRGVPSRLPRSATY